ncbi:hypothetical protein LTR78_005101 [Recurvomyces mirabilis]|uniref:Acetylxylan esterase n=1 Tax=Recurvomyces mirabilis TaxID=574656 RepID=A0AAE0WNW7_9PEZI|nr:hypothetical protein LTR78_005101 [Recurvomyces mirabilis]KAK5158284.1 hypothetical protein LTS14_003302 [Recurvomyces mirabilis]
MFSKVVAISALVAAVAAAPLEERASCPKIHVFGARETTAPVGYGSSAAFVNAIVSAYPGTTSQAITYPAVGGNSYGSSVQQGTANVGAQVNAYYQQCPSTKLVLVGYSQGSEIEDNALCGGGDLNQGVKSTAATISAAARANIKAVIWAGNPRNSPSESSFHVGSCTAGGASILPD